MKPSSSLALAATSIFGAASAYNNIYTCSYDENLDLYARDADFFDDDYGLYAREADHLNDDELYFVARSLVQELAARSLFSHSRSGSSSSSSSSGLFALPLGSGSGQPHSPAGFSPTSPTRATPHFVNTGAYSLDDNGGRRHSTTSSTAFEGDRPAMPPRRHTFRR